MPKDKNVFVCNQCGSQTPKWQGRCFECGAIGSMQETVLRSQKGVSGSVFSGVSTVEPVKLSEVKASIDDRISTQNTELDSILNGGFVAGQVVLLGGEPGVGKSTLVLQVASKFNSIYVCGEESEMQVKMRADRLRIPSDSVLLVREQEIHTIIETAKTSIFKAKTIPVIIVDSIQSVYSSEIASAPGNISQVQYCANLLTEFAKKNDVIMILIGQITKGGYLAGPKQLEHIVDTVLQIEGDRKTDLRIVRVHKNRFGSTDFSGVFKMEENGFIEAGNLLQEMASSRPKDVPGSVLSVVIEGGRPLLLEVQALNSPAQYGNARRVANGISISRLNMLLAVLERRAGIRTSQVDIYVNVSGGLKINDPALDLPVVLAIASVAKNKSFPPNAVALGEVGLLGEVKPVRFAKKRLNEAKKLGYELIVDSGYSKGIAESIRKVFS